MYVAIRGSYSSPMHRRPWNLSNLERHHQSLIQKPREAHGNPDLCQSLFRFSQSGSGCGSNAHDPAQNLQMTSGRLSIYMNLQIRLFPLAQKQARTLPIQCKGSFRLGAPSTIDAGGGFIKVLAFMQMTAHEPPCVYPGHGRSLSESVAIQSSARDYDDWKHLFPYLA